MQTADFTPAADRGTAIGLKAVADLFQALNQHGVRYCHWKSNLRLAQSLYGDTDLDLLVAREHSRVCKRLLRKHWIKTVLAPPGKRYPATENYLGFDPASGKLFHLHVHYQLVLGEQFVKNYRLPLEEQFLDSVRFNYGVKIPTPELELIVLCIRSLLKYRDRDVIKDVFSIRSPGLPTHILEEVHWLLAETSLEKVAQVLDEISDLVAPEIIIEFLNTAVSSPRNGYKLYRLRQRMRRVLRVYQRHNRLSASLRYLKELWTRRNSFLRFEPSRKMALADGGLAVAMVGVDGAGKSTLCQALAGWLSWKLDVHLYYLGSKQPSWLSQWLYILFRVARRSHRTFSDRFGEKNFISRMIEVVRQALLYCHYLSIGYDRYRRYLLGQKNANEGSIVIYDRFPMEVAFDGPKIHLAADGGQGLSATIFSRLEQSLYHKFQTPDLLVILEVSPEISMQRKPDHSWEVIKAKNLMLSKLIEGNSMDPHWVHLNTDLSFQEVLIQLKKEIWEYLTLLETDYLSVKRGASDVMLSQLNDH